MSKRASAGRYAKALFDVALQEHLLDQVATDLDGLSTLLSGHEELQRTFANPAIPAQVKRKLVGALATRLGLQGPLGKLLMLLADRDRLWLVQDLRQSFTGRLNEHRRILQAEIVTAEPLAAEQAAGSATALVADGVDVNAQLTTAFDGLKTTLGGITDAASAQAALPKLQEAVTSVDGLTAMAAKLTPTQRTMLSGLITAALPTLKELIAKVLAIPGVGDIVKPTADALMAKVEALANPA